MITVLREAIRAAKDLLYKMVILGIVTIPYLIGLLWIFTPFRPFKRFYHDFMGWHEPGKNAVKSEGVNLYSRCRFCGKEILQDSQGNWFAEGEW